MNKQQTNKFALADFIAPKHCFNFAAIKSESHYPILDYFDNDETTLAMVNALETYVNDKIGYLKFIEMIEDNVFLNDLPLIATQKIQESLFLKKIQHAKLGFDRDKIEYDKYNNVYYITINTKLVKLLQFVFIEQWKFVNASYFEEIINCGIQIINCGIQLDRTIPMQWQSLMFRIQSNLIEDKRTTQRFNKDVIKFNNTFSVNPLNINNYKRLVLNNVKIKGDFNLNIAVDESVEDFNSFIDVISKLFDSTASLYLYRPYESYYTFGRLTAYWEKHLIMNFQSCLTLLPEKGKSYFYYKPSKNWSLLKDYADELDEIKDICKKHNPKLKLE